LERDRTWNCLQYFVLVLKNVLAYDLLCVRYGSLLQGFEDTIVHLWQVFNRVHEGSMKPERLKQGDAQRLPNALEAPAAGKCVDEAVKLHVQQCRRWPVLCIGRALKLLETVIKRREPLRILALEEELGCNRFHGRPKGEELLGIVSCDGRDARASPW